MSTRTAHWVSRTTPGAAPPPPSRAASHYPGPPSTIYPESSVSNPNASRYTGRSSHSTSQHHHTTTTSSSRTHARSQSMGPPPASSARYSTSSRTRTHTRSHSGSYASAPASHYSSGSRRSSSPVAPVNTYYAPAQQPIIARTSDSDGRTDSYMIIPGKGQHVEILHPTPATSSASSYYAGSSRYTTSPTREKPLLKKLFGKVEWGDKGSSASSSASSRSSRSRRNSTGGSGAGWTVIPGSGGEGGGTRVITSGGRVVSSGGSRVVYV